MSHKIMSIKIVIIKYVFDRSIHFVTSHLMNYVKYDVIFQMPIIIVFLYEIKKNIRYANVIPIVISRDVNSYMVEFRNFKIKQIRKIKTEHQEFT